MPRNMSGFVKRRPRKGRKFTRGHPSATYIPRRIASDQTIVDLPYTNSVILTIGSDNGFWRYAGNDAFQPWPLSTVKPVGFKEWKDVYFKFEVLASVIETRVFNCRNDVGGVLALWPSYDTDAVVSFSEAVAQPYSQRGYCDSLGSGKNHQYFKQSMRTVKLLGRSDDTENLSGTAEASPEKIWWWNIFWDTIRNNDDTGAGLELNVVANVTYTVRFYERRPIMDL